MSTRRATGGRLLAFVMGVIMMLGILPAIAQAKDGSATITINKPGSISVDWSDTTINVYQVLEQEDDTQSVPANKTYTVTSSFVDFFDINTVKGVFDDSNPTVYLAYDESGKKLVATSSDPGSVTKITLTGENAKTLDATYPVPDLLKRLTEDTGDVGSEAGILYTWIAKYIEAKSISATKTVSVTGNMDSVVIGDLNEGFYALTFEDVPSGIVVNQGILLATPGEMSLKAEDLPFTKGVAKELDASSYAESATAALGDKLKYQIKTEVPQLADMSTLEKFEIQDAILNQKYVDGSMEVKIDGKSLKRTLNGSIIQFTSGSDVIATLTVTPYGEVAKPDDPSTSGRGQSFTLAFDCDKLSAFAGQEVVVTYQAELTVDAVVPTYNDATLVYDQGDGEKEIPDTAEVYTYAVELQKTFSDGSTDGYSAVKFKLYSDESLTNQMSLYKSSEGVYTLPDFGHSGSEDELTLDNSGKLRIYGLDEGTYYLAETGTKNGFNLSDTIKITLDADDNNKANLNDATTTIEKRNADGSGWSNLTRKTYKATTTAISYVDFTVYNQAGFELPSTGGAGTWALTIGGIVLVGAAATLLIVTRKKGADQQ